MKNKRFELRNIGFSTYSSQLFANAQMLVRYAAEMEKPSDKRLSEFADARIPRLRAQLLSPAPIYKSLEMAMMESNLVRLREDLSPDHSFTKLILGKQSPKEVAKAAIKGTKLDQVKYRTKLFEGGKKAIDASRDPMIQLARKLDQEMRRVRKYYEEELQAVLSSNQEKIAQALFDIYGTDIYPDATFSLRLSYGKIKGYPEKGNQIEPYTQVAGVYKRATGQVPFKLPKSWEKSKSKLNPKTAFNFVSTNDIIGGNSGSPVIDRNAEIIGLVFDGNIHSLGGAYGFDETQNRAVSVDSNLMLEALDKVYGANHLVKEIRSSRKTFKPVSAL